MLAVPWNTGEDVSCAWIGSGVCTLGFMQVYDFFKLDFFSIGKFCPKKLRPSSGCGTCLVTKEDCEKRGI